MNLQSDCNVWCNVGRMLEEFQHRLFFSPLSYSGIDFMYFQRHFPFYSVVFSSVSLLFCYKAFPWFLFEIFFLELSSCLLIFTVLVTAASFQLLLLRILCVIFFILNIYRFIILLIAFSKYKISFSLVFLLFILRFFRSFTNLTQHCPKEKIQKFISENFTVIE